MKASTMTSNNPFRQMWDLGYKRLVPITPPDCRVGEKSSLYQRMKKGEDARGKAPGLYWPDDNGGSWSGFNFVKHEAEDRDLDKWCAWEAGVGVKTGHGLVLVDADTIDEPNAAIIKEAVERHFGALPIRIGRYPKAGYLLRTDDSFRYSRVEFGETDAKGRLKDRVEILAEGRQFVAIGTHPGTGLPYRWPSGIPHIEKVPYASTETIMAFLRDLEAVLPKARNTMTEGGQDTGSQQRHLLPIEGVRKLVEKTPNTSEHFPTRDAWIKFGHAIKAAAGPEHEAEAREIWLDWSDKWDGGNDTDVAAAEFDRMGGDGFKVGGDYLIETAARITGGQVTSAEIWFDPGEAAAAIQHEQQREDEDLYEVLTVDALMHRPPPKFLIDRHIPEHSVGFLYGAPGTGKSFIALDWALSLAYRRETWFGDEIRQKEDGCVIYIAGEGSSGFRNRISAWLAHNQVNPEGGRFGLIETAISFLDKDSVLKLLRTVKKRVKAPVSMVIVDTVSRALPGADENLQKEMSTFIRTCDLIKQSWGCAVLGVHHAGVSGTMRGSTVLPGGADFIFRLERKKGAPVGVLTCEKQKDAPDGWDETYALNAVVTGVDDRGRPVSSLVVNRTLGSSESGSPASIPAGLERAILGAMAAAWDAGEPWGLKSSRPDLVASGVMVRKFGVADRDVASAMIERWEAVGAIRVEVHSGSRRRGCLRVVAGYLASDDAGAPDMTSGSDGGEKDVSSPGSDTSDGADNSSELFE